MLKETELTDEGNTTRIVINTIFGVLQNMIREGITRQLRIKGNQDYAMPIPRILLVLEYPETNHCFSTGNSEEVTALLRDLLAKAEQSGTEDEWVGPPKSPGAPAPSPLPSLIIHPRGVRRLQ